MMRALLILIIPLLLAGCDEQSMIQQKRYDPYEPSKLWRNGSEAQPLPSGTVSQGDLARDKEIKEPPPVTAALLERGRQRFDIFCSPCHGLSGKGDGMIVQRGFPPPPSYHSARLRSAPAQHFFDVITNGFGVMYPSPRASNRTTAGPSSPISGRCRLPSMRSSPTSPMHGRNCHEHRQGGSAWIGYLAQDDGSRSPLPWLPRWSWRWL